MYAQILAALVKPGKRFLCVVGLGSQNIGLGWAKREVGVMGVGKVYILVNLSLGYFPKLLLIQV